MCYTTVTATQTLCSNVWLLTECAEYMAKDKALQHLNSTSCEATLRPHLSTDSGSLPNCIARLEMLIACCSFSSVMLQGMVAAVIADVCSSTQLQPVSLRPTLRSQLLFPSLSLSQPLSLIFSFSVTWRDRDRTAKDVVRGHVEQVKHFEFLAIRITESSLDDESWPCAAILDLGPDHLN